MGCKRDQMIGPFFDFLRSIPSVRSLKQRKLKNFNQLKYKPGQNQQHITQEVLLPEEQEPITRHTSYVAVLRSRTSKTNLFLTKVAQTSNNLDQNKQQRKEVKTSNNTAT